MPQQVRQRAPERRKPDDPAPVEQKRKPRDLAATDGLLDEMDKLLEDTTVAENYQQKGGQ